MPQIFQTMLWRLVIPDAWKGEVQGEQGSFFRPEGVGLLQVHSPDTISPHDLLEYARAYSPSGTTFTETLCGRLRGFAGVRIDEDTLWRTWWLSCRGQLVYAAYQCAVKNSQDESDELDQIIQSFAERAPNTD